MKCIITVQFKGLNPTKIGHGRKSHKHRDGLTVSGMFMRQHSKGCWGPQGSAGVRESFFVSL